MTVARRSSRACEEQCPAVKGVETRWGEVGNGSTTTCEEQCPAVKGVETLGVLSLNGCASERVKSNAPL